MPATRANSDAVSARPSINACSIPARAGSPASVAISANMAVLTMVNLRAEDAASCARSPDDASALTVAFPPRPRAAWGMRGFYGWRVVGAAFVLAVFGWGLGFYGPPIFLGAVSDTWGWPLAMVSSAATAHFLVGAAVAAGLPAVHHCLGVAVATKAGALCLALGVF